MAPLGRPALPTRPYPNICATAQFNILLGSSLCYLFGLLYQLSWLLGPNKWQNFSLPLAICCFASGPSSTLSDILNPFKAISHLFRPLNIKPMLLPMEIFLMTIIYFIDTVLFDSKGYGLA